MIRPARAADGPAIRDCAERAYAGYVPLIGRKPAPMEADVAPRIAAGDVHVATGPDGTLEGFIVFYPKDGQMLLENVAVLPRAAGRGIGRALIGFCESEARRRGFTEVHLYTNARMAGNLALYPRLGYVEVGRRSEDGFDRVYFTKPLA